MITIQDHRRLKKVAAHRLENAPAARRILLIFAGILILSSLLVTTVNYILGDQISQHSGLGSIGTRSILATVQLTLPILQWLAAMVVEFGYMAAMLRIARGQYTSPMTMKMGLDRFWVLLGTIVMQGLLYFFACLGGVYLATILFSFTPLSHKAIEVLSPVIEQNLTDPQAVAAAMDETMQLQFLKASAPLYILVLIFCLALVIPMSYRYRMVNYLLMDFPGLRAIQALRSSRALMRGNKFRLFRMDLSYWWYYGLLTLASAVCYGDLLLPLLGAALPLPPTVSYFLFFILFLVLQLGIFLLFRNKVEVSYALAYEAIRPKQESTGGVAIGNIFQQ